MRACSSIEAMAFRRRLGPLQIGEGAIQILGHPLDRGEPDQGAAGRALVLAGGRERRLVGRARRRHRPEIVQDLALQAGQRETSAARGREREAALDQAPAPARHDRPPASRRAAAR